MPDEFTIDEDGLDFPDADEAYLDAYRAALDICFDMLRRRCDPARFRFEICDADNKLVMELPFSEVLRPTNRLAGWSPDQSSYASIRERLGRSAVLKKEITSQILEAQGQIKAVREKLGLIGSG